MPNTINNSLAHAKRWETFATKDACKYIKTDLANGDPAAFWRSGEQVVREELLPVLEEFEVPRRACVEIGCGVGRLLLPMSRLVERAIGIDISQEMIRRGQEFASQQRITNVQFVVADEPRQMQVALAEKTKQIDFIYSLLVFQHVPDFLTIESYVAAVGQLLSPKGLAYLQFDTRPGTLAYRLKTALPDFVLPRFFRRGIRRIRRTSQEIEDAVARNGLSILREKAPCSAHHCYMLRPS